PAGHSDNRDFPERQRREHGTHGGHSQVFRLLAAAPDGLDPRTMLKLPRNGRPFRTHAAGSPTNSDERGDHQGRRRASYPALRSFSPPTTSANPKPAISMV